MICNRTKTGWEIIYQRAHALLAAKLLTYWREADRPLRWTETLNAVAQHDNGWQEWENRNQLTPLGTPRTFDETPLEEIVQQAERAILRTWHQSLWAGLLVSRHVSHLYEPRRGSVEALDQLLDAQEPQRAHWRKHLEGVSAEEEESAYSLLLWADTFSLILCRNALPFGERAVEIGAGPDGKRYDVVQMADDGRLVVTPWPYEKERFRVAVDTYHLTQLTFESNDELADALHAAEPARRIWELSIE